MNWQKISIQRLRDYESRKHALDIIQEQIATYEQSFAAIRSPSTDGTPVSGSSASRREDALINNITMREELENNLQIAQHEIEITEKGFAALSQEQHRILYFFFINRPDRHIEFLCDDLHVEKTKLYQMKEEALKKFTLACYGVIEP